MNSILQENTVRLNRCRSRLVSLATSTTMKKCTNFINTISESIFTKGRVRKVNEFNRLSGEDRDRDRERDRELTAQPLANSTQSPAKINSNKKVIYPAPPIPGSRVLLSQRTKLYSSTQNPHLEYISSLE